MISKTKNNVNPNLNFETPGDFIKKVEREFYNTQVSYAKTYQQRPVTAFQSSTSNQRALSATSKPARKVNSSKPATNRMNIELTDQESEQGVPENNELFDDPNVDEN